MRNKVRLFRSKPKVIGPVESYPGSPTNGKFVVSADLEVGIERYQIVYLRKDGKWRKGAMGHVDGKPDGYYNTRQEARKALKLARWTYRSFDDYDRSKNPMLSFSTAD